MVVCLLSGDITPVQGSIDVQDDTPGQSAFETDMFKTE